MFEMSFMWTRENMAFAYINDYISANVNEGKAKKSHDFLIDYFWVSTLKKSSNIWLNYYKLQL